MSLARTLLGRLAAHARTSQLVAFVNEAFDTADWTGFTATGTVTPTLNANGELVVTVNTGTGNRGLRYTAVAPGRDCFVVAARRVQTTGGSPGVWARIPAASPIPEGLAANAAHGFPGSYGLYEVYGSATVQSDVTGANRSVSQPSRHALWVRDTLANSFQENASGTVGPVSATHALTGLEALNLSTFAGIGFGSSAANASTWESFALMRSAVIRVEGPVTGNWIVRLRDAGGVLIATSPVQSGGVAEVNTLTDIVALYSGATPLAAQIEIYDTDTLTVVEGPVVPSERVWGGDVWSWSAPIPVTPEAGPGRHQLNPFTLPVATQVGTQSRNNDNLMRRAYNTHDADTTIHNQSGPIADRPSAPATGTVWLATDVGGETVSVYTATGWVTIAGAGTTLTGSGTPGRLSKWAGTHSLTDSILSESGSVVTVAGTLVATALTGPLTGNASTATALATARNFSLTGDVTASPVAFDGTGNVALAATLANTAVVAGSYGSATQVGTFTVDAKGRLTVAANVTVTPAWASITGKPTTIAGYGITDFNSLGDARWVQLAGSYANPSWITSLAGSKVTGNISGNAANVTGTVAIANGGTGATTAAAARTALGATTLGANLFTFANPSAIRFIRINADNTVTARTAADFRADIGAGTGGGSVTSVATAGTVSGLTLTGGPITTTGTITLGGTLTLTSGNVTTALGFTPYNATNPAGYTTNVGTVTSVSGAGTVSGLTLTGTVTGAGSLTLGGTLAVTPANFASQTANTFLAAPNGVAGVPTFRAVVAADIPTLNQNTTGSAATLTTARTINGTSFNGSANITTANWGTSRTLTIGVTGKAVTGGANVSWSLTEIGAPSLTGVGATGTWGISITGNAATVSNITRASSASDLNTLTTAGFYRTSNTNANLPSGVTYAPMLTIYGGSDTIAQIIARYQDGDIYTRAGNPTDVGGSGTPGWSAWRRTLNDNNFHLFSPTLAGTGATGTWGISITGSAASTTGNAATATALQTARTLWGNSFDGTANINGPIALGTAVRGQLEGINFHESMALSSNLAYGGSGNIETATSWNYINAAGANNANGSALLIKGNGGTNGQWLRWMVAPVSTGAGDPLASWSQRFEVTGAGNLTVAGTATATTFIGALDAANLTGTIDNARISGAYSGITTLSVTTSVTTPLLIGNTSATRDKIRVWNSSLYTIGFLNGYTFGGLTDYAMTFQTNSTAGRGWWWGQDAHSNAQGAMALTNAGLLTVAGATRIGYGTGDTTSPATSGYMLDLNGSLRVASGGITATGNSTITGTLGGITTLTATTFVGALTGNASTATTATTASTLATPRNLWGVSFNGGSDLTAAPTFANGFVSSSNSTINASLLISGGNLDVFVATTGVTTRTSSTTDGLRLVGRAGGTSSYLATLIPTTLSANRTITIPNATGTMLLSGNVSASDIVSGTLAVARGGTGLASYTAGNYLRATGATTLAQRTPAQVLSEIGGVAGAASSTDNGIPRFDGATGKVLQTSTATIDDSGNLLLAGSISAATGDIQTRDALTTGAGPRWRLGERVASGGTTTIDDTQYIQVRISGTLYNLACAIP